MKKKIIKFLSFIALAFCMITGCGFVEDDSLVIASITSELLDDGRTMVIITYTDDEISPSIFYLPKGETGEQGIQGEGIASVEQKIDPKTGDVTITITFTNDEIDPVTYTLSNGVSIIDVVTEYDEENGVTYLTINYSNGTSSEPIAIPDGKDGKDGTNGRNGSMLTYYNQENNDDGSITLTFKYSTGEIYYCDIPAPQQGEKGEDGRGISAIVSGESEDGTQYAVTFYFTDDTNQTIYFDKPMPNTWLTGAGTPSSSEGKNGDFYFDTLYKKIYSKNNGMWVVVYEFSTDEALCEVEFFLNASDAYFPSQSGYLNKYVLKKGTNFASNQYLVPMPIREGYDFAGWYTTPNPTIVNGMFTDLTPVSSDYLALYANWVLK